MLRPPLGASGRRFVYSNGTRAGTSLSRRSHARPPLADCVQDACPTHRPGIFDLRAYSCRYADTCRRVTVGRNSMAKSELPPLSEAQLEIINIVWDRGKATVGEIWATLAPRRTVSRNTVSTMVTRLEEKGWLRHRDVGGTYLYSAAPREKVLPRMVQRWSTRPSRARPKGSCCRCWRTAGCRQTRSSESRPCSARRKPSCGRGSDERVVAAVPRR